MLYCNYLTNFDIYPSSALHDVEQLRPVLEDAIQDSRTGSALSGEIDAVLSAVEIARSGQGNRYYAVAIESGGAVVGMMGLQIPGEAMLKYNTTENPTEVINAYISSSVRGSGIGSELFRHLETKAVDDGHTELIVNSGPRYKESGWPFWTRKFGGNPIATAKDYFDTGVDAEVWTKPLRKDSSA